MAKYICDPQTPSTHLKVLWQPATRANRPTLGTVHLPQGEPSIYLLQAEILDFDPGRHWRIGCKLPLVHCALGNCNKTNNTELNFPFSIEHTNDDYHLY